MQTFVQTFFLRVTAEAYTGSSPWTAFLGYYWTLWSVDHRSKVHFSYSRPTRVDKTSTVLAGPIRSYLWLLYRVTLRGSLLGFEATRMGMPGEALSSIQRGFVLGSLPRPRVTAQVLRLVIFLSFWPEISQQNHLIYYANLFGIKKSYLNYFGQTALENALRPLSIINSQFFLLLWWPVRCFIRLILFRCL